MNNDKYLLQPFVAYYIEEKTKQNKDTCIFDHFVTERIFSFFLFPLVKKSACTVFALVSVLGAFDDEI